MNVVGWENSKTFTKVDKKSTRRTRASAPVFYEIFEEAIPCTEDPSWIQMLSKAQMNQFPQGFSYENGILIFQTKNGQRDSINIESLKGLELFTTVKDFFNRNGFITKLDRVSVEDDSQIDGDCWGKLPIPYRRAVLDKYIRSEKERNRLSSYETIMLISVIRTGFLIGILTKDSIIVKNFTIQKIIGLINEGKTYRIDDTIVPVVKSSTKTKNVTKSKKSYNDCWDTFMNNGQAHSDDEEDYTPLL